LKRLPVPVAPIDLQRSIVAELARAADFRARLVGALNTAQARAAALRRSILAAAFAGQLVPQDPADEPAAVLLERIRAEREAAGPRRRSRS
jgi:type I restriction enzyme S subunit